MRAPVTLGERGVDVARGLGKAAAVVFGGEMASPRVALQLDLEEQQLAKQHAPVVFRGASRYSSIRGESPARQRASNSSQNEWMRWACSRSWSWALVDGIAGHQATSPRASHVLRISSSRRATVRRAQPSCSAISSLL